MLSFVYLVPLIIYYLLNVFIFLNFLLKPGMVTTDLLMSGVTSKQVHYPTAIYSMFNSFGCTLTI